MKRILILAIAACFATNSAFAAITTTGTVILSSQLVGTVDYSISGFGRVTIDAFAGSKVGDAAFVTSYSAKLDLSSAAPGSLVSSSHSPTGSFWGSAFSPAVSYSTPVITWSGDSTVTSTQIPDDTSTNRTSGLIKLGTATFDVARQATDQNYTINFLTGAGGSSFIGTNGAVPTTQSNITANSLTFTITGSGGGGSGGGGGGGAGGGAAVPEPGSVLAISAVLGGLGIRALRRRRQAQVA